MGVVQAEGVGGETADREFASFITTHWAALGRIDAGEVGLIGGDTVPHIEPPGGAGSGQS